MKLYYGDERVETFLCQTCIFGNAITEAEFFSLFCWEERLLKVCLASKRTKAKIMAAIKLSFLHEAHLQGAHDTELW